MFLAAEEDEEEVSFTSLLIPLSSSSTPVLLELDISFLFMRKKEAEG